MSRSFVPLFAQTLSKAAQTTAGQFSPTLLKTVESTMPAMAAVQRGESAPVSNCRPTVTFERDGDFVRQIRIHCTCGDVIELDCSY
jgi:hypothetical protein